MAFGQGGYGGGNRRGGNSYGGGRGGFGGNRQNGFNKPSYAVRCDDCGSNTTVPFKPNGSKPVLCRDCFQGGSQGSFDRRPTFDRPQNRFEDRPRPPRPSGPAPVGPSLKSEIQAINRKLDQILAILNDVTVETQEHEEDSQADDSSEEIE